MMQSPSPSYVLSHSGVSKYGRYLAVLLGFNEWNVSEMPDKAKGNHIKNHSDSYSRAAVPDSLPAHPRISDLFIIGPHFSHLCSLRQWQLYRYLSAPMAIDTANIYWLWSTKVPRAWEYSAGNRWAEASRQNGSCIVNACCTAAPFREGKGATGLHSPSPISVSVVPIYIGMCMLKGKLGRYVRRVFPLFIPPQTHTTHVSNSGLPRVL